MASIKRKIKIPVLRPAEFDNYIFEDWKPPVSTFYSKFHIERIENYKKHLRLPLLPHRRLVYFFIFLTKGRVVRSKGLNTYEIKPNMFFFLPSDHITTLEYVSTDAAGYYCHFVPELFTAFNRKDLNRFSFFELTSEPIVQIQEKTRIIQLLQILENENKKNEIHRFELISIYLLALLSEVEYLLPKAPPKVRNASTRITQQFKLALTQYIGQKTTIKEFARFLSVSPNHLNKCVQSTVGKSAHELLDEMRILEAKVLLLQSDLTIREIAFKITRFEASDFARFFKSKTGLSPYRFRTEHID